MNPPLTPDDAMQPASAEEVLDAVAERAMQYRATKNGFLGYARSKGWEFPKELRQLDPDYVEGE